MNERILDLLRRHAPGYLSGEEISRRLGVTRAAVWKRIKTLRAAGYEIEASRRSGYRLARSPDLLSPWEVRSLLKNGRFGKGIHYFQTIDSTNSKAYQLALQGAEEGEIVIAESQERGKGRLGRQWLSPPLCNLILSVILRPEISPQQAPLLTLMAAVAAADGIEEMTGLHPTIKWPNDLLLGGKKVAGLLNEIHSEMDRVHFVILGIGVNLNMDRGMFPREIRESATSLKLETGAAVSRKEFLASLLKQMEQWYSVFLSGRRESILRAWKERARIKDKPVRVVSFGEVLVGTAVGIDSHGALILRTAKGEKKRVVAGDVEYRAETVNVRDRGAHGKR